MNHTADQFCRRTRREFLWETGAGFGALGLTGLLGNDPVLASRSQETQVRQPDGAEAAACCRRKAKSVIFLFMYGGPSHVDTFDYKPELYPLDGKTIHGEDVRPRRARRTRAGSSGPKWEFKQYGQCGKMVSDLFPNLGDLRRRHRVHPLACTPSRRSTARPC